ncbi:hypothetical protein Nepgr_006985 [Nepenthes gracilis]|uniref:TPX2 C-terminal domain-containing protein n=1 Tax=Nepenthes gracilis TaxID=150966 RepID=A0AAD3XHY4_NEPGR|nr:hypothetical protein Nepgr_006985 [Nepenthes gracilis]
MEKPQAKVAQKVLTATSQSAVSWGSATALIKGQQRDNLDDKEKAFLKPTLKENTKPLEIKLRTQQRAAKRAIFNHFVETKLNLIEQEKKQLEKLQKLIEEEEIRIMRKEMVPKAQLMPYFDRPFFPQRSNRALTIPRDPSIHVLSSRCWRCISCNELYRFQHFLKL